MPSIGVSAGSVARPQTARRLSSAELLAGAREAVIVHGQDEYRLRLTSNGKLILTK
jgi:hemin uptake protein HemP